MNDRRPRPLADVLDRETLELAALTALSALSPAEMEAVEREQRGRRAFWDEVRSLRAAAAGLAASGPRARPARDLWPAIRAGLRASEASPPVPAQVWKQWPAGAPDPSVVVPADGQGFEPTDIAGIHVRRLFVDEAADRITMLIRMEPGTSYPAHRHGGAEECYVLQGDLEVGSELEMHAGDYQRMDAGSRHPVQATRGGCLLLVTSSRHDQLLDD